MQREQIWGYSTPARMLSHSVAGGGRFLGTSWTLLPCGFSLPLWPASLWMEMGGYRRPQLLLSSAPSLLLFRQKALPVLVPAMLGTKQIGMIILQGTVHWAWETFSCCVTGSISSCRRNPLSQEALSGPDGQTPYLTLKLSLSC